MGSRLGWIIAVIFAAFVVIVIVKVVVYPSATPPTRATTGAGMLTRQHPSRPIRLVLGATPDAAGDAGDDYWNALQLYETNASALREVFLNYVELAAGRYRLTASEVDLLRQVADAVAAGAAKGRMTYYFRLTPKKIEIPYYASAAEKFQDLAGVLRMLSVHYAVAGKETHPQAERCLFDMLVMGWHMMNERARLDTVRAGVGLQEVACDLLARLYLKWNKPERLGAVKEYKEGLWDIKSTYTELYEVVWQLEQRSDGGRGPHPGDVFNVAEHHADRAVRVEAILSLGVVKLTVTSRGDRRYVRKLIAAKLTSDDPIERVAAECADALDRAGLQRLASTPLGG